MRAVNPHLDIPGDDATNIMCRSGALVGMSKTLAVWRFGFLPKSPAAAAYKIHLPYDGRGFLWAITTRKTGKVIDQFRGSAIELPYSFRTIIDWEPA
jgi:hypothetical protein